MSPHKSKVFIVGHFPYPKGLASSQYVFYIRKALKKSGHSVSIYTFSRSFNKYISLRRNVRLFFLSFSYFCFNMALLSNILFSRLTGAKVTIYYYGRSKAQFKLLIFFKNLSLSNLVTHISEYEPSFYISGSVKHKKTSSLYDDFATYSDKLIFISKFAQNYFLKMHFDDRNIQRHDMFYVLPPITDTFKIQSCIPLIREKNYILYCANLIEYIEDAIFVIEVLARLKIKDVDLVLIGSSNAKTLIKLNKLAESLYVGDRVYFHSEYLSNKDLYSYYRGASALLAPLEENLRNRSRFPYKIAQYISSGSIVVTSPVGEIGDVLTKTNSVLLAKYDLDTFSQVLDTNLIKVNNELSLNSVNFAKKYFDYRNYVSSLQSFLKH